MDETLDDLLNLFQLEMPITEEDIKLSKKKVLLLHLIRTVMLII